jgi:hypothetical protein
MRTQVFIVSAAIAAAVGIAVPAQAQTCTEVSGKFNEMILPHDSAPNDPAGRIVGNVDGSLAGATTAFITALTPARDGGFSVKTTNAFATLEGNVLIANGSGDWTFIRTSYYQVELTLTVTGGSGKYANATGSIKLLGVGNAVGQGTGQFLHEYRGQVCTK